MLGQWQGLKSAHRLQVAWLCSLLLLSLPTAWAAEVQGARFFQDARKARLVLELNENVDYKISTLARPTRLVIDIPDGTLQTDLTDLNLSGSVVKKLRYGGHRKFLRVVLDLNQNIKLAHFMLFPTERYSYRLVVDMHKPDGGWLPSAANALKEKVQLKTNTFKRDIVVLIDPGHGGKDSGAVGPTGVQEKRVVLNIARELKRLFDAQPGYRVELTRTGDYYVGLRERLKKAREIKADVFVSIHADAFHNARSRGASIYAVSERGASSEAAHWLAEKENYSELGRVNLEDKADHLREVLISLSQSMTIAQSLQIGRFLLDKLKGFAKLHHETIEQAPFVVLKSPDIPSVLVETGFISNPYEETRLSTPKYQRQLARAIHQGMLAYFEHHPPEDVHHTAVALPRSAKG